MIMLAASTNPAYVISHFAPKRMVIKIASYLKRESTLRGYNHSDSGSTRHSKFIYKGIQI